MANKRLREETSAGARRIMKRIFEFYALIAMQFALRRRRIRQKGARRCISTNVTATKKLRRKRRNVQRNITPCPSLPNLPSTQGKTASRSKRKTRKSFS